MAEPIATAGGIFGLKYSTMLGGFVGSLIALSFVSPLGWWARVSAVITGTATAAYCTPVIVAYWAVGSAAENGLGFLLGLTSMNIVPGVIHGSRWMRCNIKRILTRYFGFKDDEGDK